MQNQMAQFMCEIEPASISIVFVSGQENERLAKRLAPGRYTFNLRNANDFTNQDDARPFNGECEIGDGRMSNTPKIAALTSRRLDLIVRNLFRFCVRPHRQMQSRIVHKLRKHQSDLLGPLQPGVQHRARSRMSREVAAEQGGRELCGRRYPNHRRELHLTQPPNRQNLTQTFTLETLDAAATHDLIRSRYSA